MTDARQDDSVTARPDPATLDEQRAGDEIADLTAQIAKANEDYHLKDAPALTDAEYDALKRRLLALERAFPQLARPDSPTRLRAAGVEIEPCSPRNSARSAVTDCVGEPDATNAIFSAKSPAQAFRANIAPLSGSR